MRTAKQEVDQIFQCLENPKVAEVRKGIQKLSALFGSSSFRERLANESGGNGASIVLKRLGLSTIWELSFRFSIQAIKFLASKKKIESSEYKSFQTLLELFGQEHESELDLRPRLSLEVGGKVKDFVIGYLFGSDHIVDAVEEPLILVLKALCSKREFVGIFKPSDLDEIMDILEPRLSVDSSSGYHTERTVLESSAQLLDRLVETCMDIGISMHNHAAECLSWASRRCHSFCDREGETSQKAVTPLIKAATKLIRSEPEHAIGPMRNCGLEMMKYAKSNFAKSSGPDKDAVVEYLMAHLLICQVAGRLQGLAPGDFGDLGKASLDSKSINLLLNTVASEDQIKRMSDFSTDTGGHRNVIGSWKPIDPRLRNHLELCARLLGASQRLFLVSETYKSLKDPVDTLIERFTHFEDSLDNGWSGPTVKPSPLTPSIVSKSPFMQHLLWPLWDSVASMQPSISFNTNSDKFRLNLDREARIYSFPLLSCLIANRSEANAKTPGALPFLQLLCALSEVFPFGGCWSTSVDESWYETAPNDPLNEDFLSVNICSQADLAAVVVTVARVLESAGHPGGDASIQLWALRGLLQLSQSTACLASVSSETLRDLSAAWQIVWHMLVAPTFQYSTLTKTTFAGSRGELVVLLLGKIIYFCCTDLDAHKAGKRYLFLTSEVGSLWSLSSLSDPIGVESSYAFHLISCVLLRCGVRDEWKLKMEGDLPLPLSSSLVDELGHLAPRCNRIKLFCFCMKRVAHEIKAHEKRTFTRSTPLLLSSLATVCAALCSGAIDRDLQLFGLMFSTAMEKIPESFSVVVMAPDAYHRNSISSVVEGDDVQASVFPRVMDHAAESRSIVVKLVRSYICLDREDDRDPVSAHSSLVMSRALLQCAFASSSGNDDSETSEEHLYEGKSRDPYLLVKALAIRLCLPVAFSQQLLSLNYEIQQDIAEKTVSFLDDLIKLIETGVDEGHLQTEIVPFVEGFVSEFLCVVPLKFSQQNVRHAFRNLKEVFCDMLERIRLCRTQIQSNSSWRRKRNIDFDDEEEEEYYEDFPADAEGKRKRSVEQSGNKKRRAGLSSLSTNSLTSARSIASILINLEPSLRMRRFVLNQLSLVDADEDGRPNSLVDSFDIVGAEMSLDIVFSRLELPMETNEEEESLLSMCIETIQRIRDGTHGGDENFCSGFFHLKMILHREVKDVSNDDTNLLVHVLMVNDAKDTRWLKMRPHLLLQRLECAVTAYEKSGSSFRALFSRMFNSEFVIEALNSHSLSMRVASAHVVGVTLRNLANQDLVSQKVIEALIFGRVNDESPILATITDAQKSRDDSLCWKHSAVFVRYSVAYVWGVIGGCTRELSVCRDKLFDCIHMASLKTPYQPICQIAIRKMASLRGYLSAQAFVSDETESLWLKWMSSLPESRAFPLNLSSGELLHGVRDMGLIWIYSWRSSDDEGEIIKVLTDEVSKDFLSANVQRAIPLCLSLLSSKELDLFDLGEYSSVSSNLMARIRNMNIVSQDESERERTPLAFVSTLAPSIIAFALLRRLSVSEKIEAENPLLRFGLNLILRNEIIDPTNNDLLETRYRKVHSIIKVFLDMSGSSVAAGEVPGCKIPDLLGLDMYTPSDWPDTGDVFRLGAIEFLMQCKYLLFKAQTDERRVMRWKALEWVASKIVEDQSFCSMVHEMTLQTMLGLLWSREMLCCHEHALSFLREHMQSSIKTLTSGERSQSFIGLQLLLTLVEIHGRSSKAIAEEIRKHSVGKNDGSHSFGLLSFEVGTNAGGVWGWDAFDVAPMNLAAEKDRCLGILDPRHVSLARLTYDVLDDMLLILTHSSISESMVTLVEEENLEHLLCFLDEKFSILQLLKDHIDKRPEVDDSEQLSAAKSRLICSMQELSTTDYLFEGSQGVQELSLDSRLLMYHFRDLRRILTHSSSNYRSLPTVEDYAIVRYLLNIASDRSKPNKLRVEASKCIGAFGSSYIASLSMIDGAAWPENWLAEIEPKRDSLHLVCISRSLRFLLEHVRLDQPPLTLAVLTACKEVARTQEGVDALSLMKESREKTFMASLLQAGLKPRKKPTLLAPPSSYMGDIMELAKERNESEMTSANWCWSTKLWDVTDTSFEEWMKRIVCSLIICCYSGKTVPGEVRGSRSSFRAFAKVSALSSSISSHIFPWLVIDLLFSDQHPTAQNNELVDQTFVKEAWIGNPQSLANKRISQCFNIVIKSLKNCVEGDSRGKICNVLAETIDLLRKISQKLFLAHESFPLSFRAKEDMRIPGTLDNIVVGVSKKPRSFGSVLNIPPVSTVEAFVGAGRIASAAYFAESALLRTGFKTLISPDDLADRKKQSGKTRETQSSLMSLLRDCMIDLQEFDNASAFSLNLASLNFSGMGFRLADHVLLDNADPYNALKLLSNGEPVGGSRKTAIALALGTLGTKEALDAYINTAIRDGQLCEDEKSNLKEIWVEATLKGMHWSEVDSTIDGESILSGRDSGPFEDLLTAFGSLVRLDYPMFGELVASSRLRALEQIMSKYSRESTLTKIIPSVECFETLNDLDGIAYDHESRQSVIRHWVREQAAFQESFYRIPLGRFSDLDVAIREATLRALRSEEKFEKIDLYECYLTHLWQSSAIARRQGRSDLMQRCIQRLEIALKGEQECDRLSHLAVRFEEASLMESRGYSKVAIYAAKLISTELNELLPVMDKPRYFDVERLRAESLVSCGTWASRYGAESAKDIQEDYLLPAMQVCKDLYNERKTPSSTRRLADACIALAQNSASLFENVEGHMNSKEWRDKDEFLQEQQTLLDHLETQKKSQQYRENEPSEDKILRTRVRMMVEQLEDEISGEDEALKKYAELALQSFGHAFELADNSSDENWTRHAFQMISIWFTVSARLPEINSGLKEVFLKIPSYRFVPLVYQLFARLNAREGEEFNPFQELLRDVVVGVCHDHPYHCILQLLALIHSQDCGTSELYDTKVLAAKRVLEELRRIAGENRLKLYDGYEAVHQAYQSLAAAPLSKEDANSRKKQIAISSVVSKRECQLDRVVRKLECRPCILTKPPTLQPSHDYGGLRTDPPGTELLMEVLPHFDVADSGVTRPKVLHCKGSRGTKFKQLLKSSPSDDIRQDAVMQQVFTYTNKLMRQRGTPSRGAPEGQKRTCRNKLLRLVTYNAVPLSPTSGLLEWVEDTHSLNEYLTDRSHKTIGAHSRYCEGEWNHTTCMLKMKRAANRAHNFKRREFDEVCSNISPVLRYFFVERFGYDLQTWHTARMAYTRSCAVSSIVGHILGLGDRHNGNILIQRKTGELVHIDFGIVFEQGRLLPVPETVPFRLTRDIVDGLGPLGTEGAFTAVAEETISILRENASALLTILSSVVSDPLSQWKKASMRARGRQQCHEGNEDDKKKQEKSKKKENGCSSSKGKSDLLDNNLTAKHAITRIKEKLAGYEEGTSNEQHTVEGQVQLLINAARDPDNLCEIFHGWAAWL